MLITYKDTQLAFRFKHNTQLALGIPRGTECTVTDMEGNFIAKTFARLHPKDNFDKVKGRKIAFGRALQEFVPKTDRLPFWIGYANWRSEIPRLPLVIKANLQVV